jgi:predicted ATP-dependent endonuclease of OLD family
VNDNEEKLQEFNLILKRVNLFQSLINDRFIHKKMEIDRKEGFKITSLSGKAIPLDSLSSSEQHQLILVFELIFELQENKNSLILIDEPELSLHVSWQRRFIGDLEQIISVNRFDVILATHSPQLIGLWKHLEVELGDVEA